jgi:hypothetical protein
MWPIKIIRKIHHRIYEVQEMNGKKMIRNVEGLKLYKQCDNNIISI